MTCIGPRCNARAVQRHHVIEKAELKRRWKTARRAETPMPWSTLRALLDDDRNLVGVCVRTHERHSSATSRLPVWVLPDSVFEFAVELMGAGAAYNYISRFYAGDDPRLDALLDVAA